VAGLRGALDGALQGVLEIAAPQLRRAVPSVGHAGVVRQAAARDVLDDLLANLAGDDGRQSQNEEGR
jgi:hypothetical protein